MLFLNICLEATEKLKRSLKFRTNLASGLPQHCNAISALERIFETEVVAPEFLKYPEQLVPLQSTNNAAHTAIVRSV